MNPLYIFISHQRNLNNCYDRICQMMSGHDFIVVQGGFISDSYESDIKLLSLNCNDGYVGLPEKVIKTFHYLISNKRFEKYTHFIKLDDDMIVKKKIDVNVDYVGKVHYGDGNRQWHMGRTNTFWDKVPYLGEFKPWCMGGFGYVISRNALEKVLPNFEYSNHIYEDVYIGLLMNKIGIVPTDLNVKEFFESPEH